MSLSGRKHRSPRLRRADSMMLSLLLVVALACAFPAQALSLAAESRSSGEPDSSSSLSSELEEEALSESSDNDAWAESAPDETPDAEENPNPDEVEAESDEQEGAEPLADDPDEDEGSLIDPPTIDIDTSSYYDEDEVSHSLPEGTQILTSSMTTLSSGWYLVSEQVSFSSRIVVSGDVTLVLGGWLDASKGITVSEGNRLTIYSQDSPSSSRFALTASGSDLPFIEGNAKDDQGGAAIGGAFNQNCGTVTINGGIIEANGGECAAGIGGGYGRTAGGQGGAITINNGTVQAAGGSGAAGIGGGVNGDAGTITINGGTVKASGQSGASMWNSKDGGPGIGAPKGQSGTVTINGGEVQARGTGYGAAGVNYANPGIGSQRSKDFSVIINGGSVSAAGDGGGSGIDAGVGSITITGGTVKATGSDGSLGGEGGPGIGAGDISDYASECGGTITISGGYVEAQGGEDCPGIRSSGSVDRSDIADGTVAITGGTVIATGKDEGAGIGGGNWGMPSCGSVTISGGTVLANGGSGGGAGIGGGEGSRAIMAGSARDGNGGKITITGGTVTATGSGSGAGIGGGDVSNSGYITISGGTVKAYGSSKAAGIGGGDGDDAHGDVWEITISGGDVSAYGGDSASAIGGGYQGNAGTIRIAGGTVYAESSSGAGIGGHWNNSGTVTISSGTVTAAGSPGIGAAMGTVTFDTTDTGDAIVYASSISDNDDTSGWSGIIFEGASGKVYGGADGVFDLPQGTTEIPASGKTSGSSGFYLENPAGTTFNIAQGSIWTYECTLDNKGTINVIGDVAVGDTLGTLTNTGTINKKAPYSAPHVVEGSVSYYTAELTEVTGPDSIYGIAYGSVEYDDTKNGADLSLGDITWQASTNFDTLSPGVEHAFYASYNVGGSYDFYDSWYGMLGGDTAQTLPPEPVTIGGNEDDAALNVQKTIEGRAWQEGDAFTFEIRAGTVLDQEGNYTGDAPPLPDETQMTISHDPQSASDAVSLLGSFGEIEYNDFGIYTYTIIELFPHEGESLPAVTYDDHSAPVSVKVRDKDKDGQLEAYITYDNSYALTDRDSNVDDAAAFTNVYATSLDYVGAGGLDVDLLLEDHAIASGQFSFAIAGEDEDSAALLASQPTTVSTAGAQRLEDGDASERLGLFSDLTFTNYDNGDVFTFTVSQTSDKEDGYTLDETIYTVTISISDDGHGTLTATTTVTSEDGYERSYTYTNQEEEGVAATVPFTNLYAASAVIGGDADGSGDDDAACINATKTLIGRDMSEGEFSFSVVAENADGETKTYITGSNAAAAAGHSAPIAFDETGFSKSALNDDVVAGFASYSLEGESDTYTYDFAVSEITENFDDRGLTAEVSSFELRVVFSDSNDGTMSVELVYPDEASTEDGDDQVLAFVNSYKAAPVDVVFSAQVELEGRDIEKGEFTFVLYDASGNELQRSTNDADGSISFSAISFDAPASMAYRLTQIAGDDPAISYDTASYAIDLTLEDNNEGNIVVSSLAYNGKNTEPVFHNQYSASDDGGNLVSTGDPGLSRLVACACLAIALAFLTALVVRRKKTLM